MDVSVIIPTFNRANKLIDAINSCLKNTCISIEVIIVDDGSQDHTKTLLLESYSAWHLEDRGNGFFLLSENDSIQYIYQENSGAPMARNNGLMHARGDFIKFLDADDLLIEDTLTKEIKFARKNNAEVVVTGWIVRNLNEEGKIVSEIEQPAPDISRGIDDMLEGKASWTSAALYRKSSIDHLKWDKSIEKAQEWMWAWTVCFDGVPFSRLDIPSTYYVQYQSKGRITQQGDPLLRSTQWRLKILNKVETILREKNLLTPERARKLIQYYYKDARVVCQSDSKAWAELVKRMKNLDDNYKPEEKNPIVRLFNQIFGLHKGIILFVFCRNMVKKLYSR